MMSNKIGETSIAHAQKMFFRNFSLEFQSFSRIENITRNNAMQKTFTDDH